MENWEKYSLSNLSEVSGIRTEKIAFLLSVEESDWVSCRSITSNLIKLYRKSFPQAILKKFDYVENMDGYKYFCMCKELQSFVPTKLIVVDHKPHPNKLIEDLIRMYPNHNYPDIYCHLFGDFSLYTNQWKNIQSYLKKLEIKFIVASYRQVEFVKQFIVDGEKYVFYLPFPVDDEIYSFSNSIRENILAQLHWGEKDNRKNFLYTGRISQQKNVTLMMQVFAQFVNLVESNSHLYIAGFFDDLFYPFLGQYGPKEFNRYEFFEVLEKLNASFSDGPRIHFLGNLAYEELLDYYHACDVFLSLSLHNDEDYGMSPAEALCCGMPMILANWGGYASFQKTDKDQVSLVDIDTLDTRYRVSVKNFLKLLIKYDMSEFKDRNDLSLKALKLFSISGNIKRLLKLHSDPIYHFSSWNRKFKDFAICFERDHGNPFGIIQVPLDIEEKDTKNFNAIVKTKKIYRDCYNAYIG